MSKLIQDVIDDPGLTDVFFCTAPQSEERYQRAVEVLAKWRQVNGIRLTVLQSDGDDYYFQSKRRQMAEEQSESQVYLVADDDMEPAVENWQDWVTEGVVTMQRHPGFALLSPWLMNTNLVTWTPGNGYKPFEDGQVQEFHNSGGIRFTRKNAIRKWPEQTRRGYDQEQCDALREQGWRSGYFKNLWAIHPGHKSETWKAITGYQAPKIVLDSR